MTGRTGWSQQAPARPTFPLSASRRRSCQIILCSRAALALWNASVSSERLHFTQHPVLDACRRYAAAQCGFSGCVGCKYLSRFQIGCQKFGIPHGESNLVPVTVKNLLIIIIYYIMLHNIVTATIPIMKTLFYMNLCLVRRHLFCAAK